MAIVLCDHSALTCLRLWDQLPHAPRGELCRDLLGVRDATPQTFERPNRGQIEALLGVPHPFVAGRPLDLEAAESGATLLDGHVDALVRDARDRAKTPRVSTTLWSGPLPAGSLTKVQEGLYLTGPEMLFLLAAGRLDEVDLALLGCELTGTYLASPLSPFGVVERAPMTTVEAIGAHLDRADGAKWVAKARRALGLVLPGAASPMESRLALYLTLPRRLGGHGLPRPLLNYRFDVTGTARKTSDRHHYCGDLCWPEANVAVEYDSDAAHTGSDRIAADTERRNALVAMGVTVVGVTRPQARNRQQLDRAAQVVAGQLGVRVRERRQDQEARRRALHEALFKAPRPYGM